MINPAFHFIKRNYQLFFFIIINKGNVDRLSRILLKISSLSYPSVYTYIITKRVFYSINSDDLSRICFKNRFTVTVSDLSKVMVNYTSFAISVIFTLINSPLNRFFSQFELLQNLGESIGVS